mgnify:CR=1 FL=1
MKYFSQICKYPYSINEYITEDKEQILLFQLGENNMYYNIELSLKIRQFFINKND